MYNVHCIHSLYSQVCLCITEMYQQAALFSSLLKFDLQTAVSSHSTGFFLLSVLNALYVTIYSHM